MIPLNFEEYQELEMCSCVDGHIIIAAVLVLSRDEGPMQRPIHMLFDVCRVQQLLVVVPRALYNSL